MDFNYEQEENKLILANENIKNVITNYIKRVENKVCP